MKKLLKEPGDLTVREIFNTLTDDQKQFVYLLVGGVVETGNKPKVIEEYEYDLIHPYEQPIHSDHRWVDFARFTYFQKLAVKYIVDEVLGDYGGKGE